MENAAIAAFAAFAAAEAAMRLTLAAAVAVPPKRLRNDCRVECVK